MSQYSTKLGRGGQDRPPGIILRRDRNMVPAEKIPESWPPITNGSINCPLCNGSAGGWRSGFRSPRTCETQRGDFFNQVQNLPLRGIEPRTWRCYSGANILSLFSKDCSGTLILVACIFQPCLDFLIWLHKTCQLVI
jgi:hypothetical protein